MQISVAPEDSPVTHFIDTLKGGHMQNDHALLKVMVEDGPAIAKWLIDLGVLFDRQADGNLHVKKGGGSSKPRLLTCSDYTGLEIMRVLKDEVINQKIQLLRILRGGRTAQRRRGQLLGRDFQGSRQPAVRRRGGQDGDSARPAASADCTFRDFPTSNHYGATGDGLCLSLPYGSQAGARRHVPVSPVRRRLSRTTHRRIGDRGYSLRGRSSGQCEG